jgi:hypothetical protein
MRLIFLGKFSWEHRMPEAMSVPTCPARSLKRTLELPLDWASLRTPSLRLVGTWAASGRGFSLSPSFS